MTIDEITGPASDYEVLVDAGAYTLGEGVAWCPLEKIGRGRFPVAVRNLPSHGRATFRPEEVLDVRKKESRAVVGV